jgi:hypothetical protein
MARQGKIARLPRAVREAINHRLADGQSAAEILAWANGLEKVRAVLDRHFDGVDISEQNLSQWRAGGYAEWLATQEREESIRSLAEFSHRLAKASGGDLTAGAAAIAAGKIYSVLEAVADGTAEEGASELDLIDALAKLRGLELDKQRVALAERKHATKEREVALAERRFQTLAVETFLKWAKSEEARKILDLGQPQHVQAARLRELMFGPSPVHE